MTITKHKDECTRIFNRYDKSCIRCKELMRGAEPRESWHKQYYIDRARENQRRKDHFASIKHKKEGVCTAFEW